MNYSINRDEARLLKHYSGDIQKYLGTDYSLPHMVRLGMLSCASVEFSNGAGYYEYKTTFKGLWYLFLYNQKNNGSPN
jgi:hypothetical protein